MRFAPCHSVKLILYLIEAYLLEYLANNVPAEHSISSSNTEYLTTVGDDDDGASVELFEFPTRVCAVGDANEGRRLLTTSTSPRSEVVRLRSSSSPV